LTDFKNVATSQCTEGRNQQQFAIPKACAPTRRMLQQTRRGSWIARFLRLLPPSPTPTYLVLFASALIVIDMQLFETDTTAATEKEEHHDKYWYHFIESRVG
jgi:hypothetical protein